MEDKEWPSMSESGVGYLPRNRGHGCSCREKWGGKWPVLCGLEVVGRCRRASSKAVTSVEHPGLNSLVVAGLALIKRTQEHS